MRTRGALGVVALIVATLAAVVYPQQSASAAPTVYPGLGFDQFLDFGSASGVPVQAVTVAFEPTGTGIFAADKTGRVIHYSGPGDINPIVTLDIRAKVHDALDRGLTGLTLDPDFANPANRFVYITYTYDKDPFGNGAVPAWGTGNGGDNCGGGQNAIFGGCTVTALVTRFHVGANRIADQPEQVLIGNDGNSGFCNQFLSHSADSIEFGPDGYLYVSAGDGASFSNVDWGQLATRPDGVVNPCNDAPAYRGNAMTSPTAEGGVLRAQAVRTKYPADGYTPLDGTIMRINRDGTIPATNPLFNNGIPGDDRIIAFGARNPFRFTFRPTTNELFLGHVGNGTWESIDRFFPATGPVPNFGWPCYEGAHTDISNTSAFDLCTSLGSAPEAIGTKANAAQLTLPWFEFKHQIPADVGHGCNGTGAGSSITGGTFVQSTSWPIELQGQYIFGDYGRACLWSVDADSPTPTRRWIASGLSPTQVTTGPDKNVYVVDLGPGGNKLWRLGSGPTPRIAVTPSTNVQPSVPVTFDGTGSRTASGGAVASYAWDLDGNGAYDNGTTSTVSRAYPALGPVKVGLKVTDGLNNVGYTSVTIQVGTLPTISSLTTSADGGWSVGDTINYSANASDAYGVGLTYRWDVAVRHCDPSSGTSDCHEHVNVVGALPNAASGSFTAPDHEWQAYLRVTLTVTESHGLSTSSTSILPAIGVPITVDTRPSGLRVGIAEVAGTSPLSASRIVHSNVQLSVPSVQSLGGRTQVFTGWEDDPLPPADRIISPTAATSLVAGFATTDAFTPIPPVRLLDTRDGTGGGTGKVAADGVIVVQVTGANGVPADASGVVLNLTATEPDRAGFVTAYPCDAARPFASNLNFSAGQTVPNLAQVRVSAAGTVCLFAHAPTHLVADLAGYFSATGAQYQPVAPKRVLDTREGLGAPQSPVGPDGTITLDLSSYAPAGASAVVVNVTATDVAADGFITAYPCGTRPLVSNLNVARSDTRPNLAVVPLGTGATVCLFAQSRVSLVADIAGWYVPAGSKVITQTPRRIMDTRDNLGATGPLAPRTAITVDLAAYAPAGATAVVMNLTSVEQATEGFVTAYPCGELPTVSNLNVAAGDTRPNLVMVRLAPAAKVCLYPQSATNLVADIAGWVL